MSYKGLCTSKYLIITGFQQQKLHSLIKGGEEIFWRDKASVRSGFRYSRDYEPSDWEFKNKHDQYSKGSSEKVDNFQEQMDNENREIETLRKNIQEIVE